MANFIGLDKSYIPDGSGAVTANRFVTMGSDDQHVDITPNSAGILVLGVVMESLDATKAATGKAVLDVRLAGIAPVTASAAISLGAEVATTTAGKAATATTGNRVAGIALQAAAADLDIINVLLTPAGRIV